MKISSIYAWNTVQYSDLLMLFMFSYKELQMCRFFTLSSCVFTVALASFVCKQLTCRKNMGQYSDLMMLFIFCYKELQMCRFFTFSSCVFTVVLIYYVCKQHICMKYGSIQRFTDVVHVLLERTIDLQVCLHLVMCI